MENGNICSGSAGSLGPARQLDPWRLGTRGRSVGFALAATMAVFRIEPRIASREAILATPFRKMKYV